MICQQSVRVIFTLHCDSSIQAASLVSITHTITCHVIPYWYFYSHMNINVKFQHNTNLTLLIQYVNYELIGWAIDTYRVDMLTIVMSLLSYWSGCVTGHTCHPVSAHVSLCHQLCHLYLNRPREANRSFNSAAMSLHLTPGLISSSPLLWTWTLASQTLKNYFETSFY